LEIALKLKEISDLLEPDLGKVPAKIFYQDWSVSLLCLRAARVYAAVSVANLHLYAVKHGWICEDVKNHPDTWKNTVKNADDGFPLVTFVPYNADFTDYGSCVKYFIQLTASLEKRSEWHVLVEMLQS